VVLFATVYKLVFTSLGFLSKVCFSGSEATGVEDNSWVKTLGLRQVHDDPCFIWLPIVCALDVIVNILV
jgi:hypothetical protein